MRLRSLGLRALVPSAAALLGLCGWACSGSSTSAVATNDGGSGVIPGKDSGVADQSLDVYIGSDTGSSKDADSCKTGQACGDGGVCTGETCCEPSRACGELCCAQGQLCSFGKCVAPGVECHDSTDCLANQYCEYSIGSNKGAKSFAAEAEYDVLDMHLRAADGGDAQATDAGAADAKTPDAGDAGACTGSTNNIVGKCLPRPPICATTPDGGTTDGGAKDASSADSGMLTCLQECQYVPPTTTFQAKLKYAWGGDVTLGSTVSDVMMMPIVIQLDDDDCDGKITANDIPEIVFSTYAKGAYTEIGTIHAISIVKDKVVEKWKVPGLVNAAGELASGNIDGKPGNEVVACGKTSAGTVVYAFSGSGKVLWTSKPVGGCRIPAVADLGSDGSVEVIVEGAILDGATGAEKAKFVPALAGSFVVSDIDGDNQLDVVTSSQGYHADGKMFVDTGRPGSWPAIGDFDKNGVPEVVAINQGTHLTWIWHYDASKPEHFSIVRDSVDINGSLDPASCPDGSAGNKGGGGPPTVADFDGDTYPDIALAGGVGYAILSGKKLIDPSIAGPKTFLWVKKTHDCSSAATGSSIFDFNGDGNAEVVYSDEYYLRIYDGKTGEVKWEECNTTGTLIEYPVVADVNNDGQADIVVASNAYAYTCAKDNSRQSGVRIFTSAGGNWVRTRRVWNQHTYHITNIGEDGTIPTKELPNWKQPGLNNFRQNKQPGSEFAAPDAVVGVQVPCGAAQIVATVRNVGEAALPAELEVTFYEGDPKDAKKLGVAKTTAPLYSAQAEQVVLSLASPSKELAAGSVQATAVVAVPASIHECRPANNTGSGKAVCDGPK